MRRRDGTRRLCLERCLFHISTLQHAQVRFPWTSRKLTYVAFFGKVLVFLEIEFPLVAETYEGGVFGEPAR
jgi:hypothetical protein